MSSSLPLLLFIFHLLFLSLSYLSPPIPLLYPPALYSHLLSPPHGHLFPLPLFFPPLSFTVPLLSPTHHFLCPSIVNFLSFFLLHLHCPFFHPCFSPPPFFFPILLLKRNFLPFSRPYLSPLRSYYFPSALITSHHALLPFLCSFALHT